MRVATWNLDRELRPGAVELLLDVGADVLLLTEPPSNLELEGYSLTPPGASMPRGQLYAAVASRLDTLGPLEPLPAPHPATTAAVVQGTTFVSTVLPWSSAESDDWRGSTFTERTVHALDDLEPFLRAQPRLVWGGDWNHALEGGLHWQTRAGRDRLELLLGQLALEAPTRHQPRGVYEMQSIDHIAVPGRVVGVEHHSAEAVDGRLSDHDLYVVVVD